MVGPWIEFKTSCDFMMIRALGCEEPIFQFREAWDNIITKLLLREEFQLRENNMDILQCIFWLHFVSPLPLSPASSTL